MWVTFPTLHAPKFNRRSNRQPGDVAFDVSLEHSWSV